MKKFMLKYGRAVTVLFVFSILWFEDSQVRYQFNNYLISETWLTDKGEICVHSDAWDTCCVSANTAGQRVGIAPSPLLKLGLGCAPLATFWRTTLTRKNSWATPTPTTT